MRGLSGSSARLAALLFVAIFVPTLAMLGFMSYASAQTLASQRATLVTELRDELVAEYDGGGPGSLTGAIRDRLRYNPLGEEVLSYRSAKGAVLVGNLGTWPAGLGSRSHWLTIRLQRPGDRQSRPVVLLETVLPDHSTLLTGHVASGSAELNAANQWAFLLALLVAGPVSLGLAFVLLRVIERRVARIALIAERVGEGDLSPRVELGQGDDAFARLGRGFNAMLDKIEALVLELRLVTDGLAHDLRSPVTRLQSVIERAAARQVDPEAGAALETAQQEAASLQAMLTTAIQISRAEAGIGRDRFAPAELATVLDDLVEIYGPLAEESGFTIAAEAPPGLVLPVHRELLGQALGNLIENALRYAEGGSRIALGAAREDGEVAIVVADDGPGIAAGQRHEALRRFGRLDPSRHAAGSGLGLSLVEAAARLHGGRIELEDARPGLLVRVILPDGGKAPASPR
ncbi:MAG: HAMP domain-containing sensor histidine kinase [Candidatus Andeanibacterium colombiense]|uniref:histidine kinase n=1 Tax=Candidatus Andeanibacterium colombiense TaxID=3121345 RepID=A0AAJ5X2U5_9SPHN|nr:MAG: HAMP domain-containing sensor histidine kinase [Sphingomonadaceae bacterium]